MPPYKLKLYLILAHHLAVHAAYPECMRSSTLFLLISAMVLALITLFTIFVFLPVAFGTGLASLLLILLALPDLVAADKEYELKERAVA